MTTAQTNVVALRKPAPMPAPSSGGERRLHPGEIEKLIAQARKALAEKLRSNPKAVETISDGGGLTLAVRDGGASWVYKYKQDGKTHNPGLGKYPEVSLAVARTKRDDIRARAKQGENPAAERQAARQAVREARTAARQDNRASNNAATFARYAIEYHEAFNGQRLTNDKNRKKFINDLRRLVFPAIGEMRVDFITPAMIADALMPHRDKYDTVKKTFYAIGVVFDYAILRERGKMNFSNPTEEAKQLVFGMRYARIKQPEPVEHRAWDVTRMPEFVAKLRENKSAINRATEFLGIVPARCGTVRLAEWKEFDLENGVWNAPPEHMKGRKAHQYFLSKQAIAIVESMRGVDSKFVFPADKTTKHPHESRPLSEGAFESVFTRASAVFADGVKWDVECVPHGLRTTFSTWADANGINERVVDYCMAHAAGKSRRERGQRVDPVRFKYARAKHQDARRVLMQAYADVCEGKKVDYDKLRRDCASVSW